MNRKKFIAAMGSSLIGLHGYASGIGKGGAGKGENTAGSTHHLCRLTMTRLPKKYWRCTDVLGEETRNQLNETSRKRGLPYHLLCQSLAGLSNRAVEKGKSDEGVWLLDHAGRPSYQKGLAALENRGARMLGQQTGVELATMLHQRGSFDGYVLTDVENNPESNIVASVAAHVFNALIVDVRDQRFYESAGYSLSYDARRKSTVEAWHEFKGRCNNHALVVMPVQTGEMRDFAITHGLFVLNVNKRYADPTSGQNLALFEEVLQWLAPGAPIFGWESKVGEKVFVDRASLTGHTWIPCDWAYNLPLMSVQRAAAKQAVPAKVKSDDPRCIDFSKKKHFVAYYLSDGDNVQWMLNNYDPDYFNHEACQEMKMGLGMAVYPLSAVAPTQLAHLIARQPADSTIIESLGGGYIYVDTFAKNTVDRVTKLRKHAEQVADTMKQHGVKVLGLMAHDLDSPAALEGFRLFAKANDQLEGIVAIQYSPYAGGKGSILWVQNGSGFDIPVVTAKYSLWNKGNVNKNNEGTPAFVANRLKAEQGEESFSLISVHAWSKFKDCGMAADELEENRDGNLKGPGAAKLCKQHLDDNFETVSVQELIWRIRARHQPEQTARLLREIY